MLTDILSEDIASEPGGQPLRSVEAKQRLDGLIERVARTYAVRAAAVRGNRRGSASTARVRQIVMYLAHVGLGLSPSEVARLLGRDRTSVVHACRVIEDAREEPAIDAALQVFEESLRLDARRRT